jgi:membrane protein implicated in regulation of membrane protease activity
MLNVKSLFLLLFIIVAAITIVSLILTNNYTMAFITIVVLFLVVIDFVVRTVRKNHNYK